MRNRGLKGSGRRKRARTPSTKPRFTPADSGPRCPHCGVARRSEKASAIAAHERGVFCRVSRNWRQLEAEGLGQLRGGADAAFAALKMRPRHAELFVSASHDGRGSRVPGPRARTDRFPVGPMWIDDVIRLLSRHLRVFFETDTVPGELFQGEAKYPLLIAAIRRRSDTGFNLLTVLALRRAKQSEVWREALFAAESVGGSETVAVFLEETLWGSGRPER